MRVTYLFAHKHNQKWHPPDQRAHPLGGRREIWISNEAYHVIRDQFAQEQFPVEKNH